MQEKNKPHEISAAHSTVWWSAWGAPSLPHLWQISLWQAQKCSLERDASVRRICCILTAADLWAGNAVQQTAGEEHFPAVLQVRAEVLRTMRISVCLVLVLLPLFYWALKGDDWTDFESERNCLLCLNNLRRGGTWELLLHALGMRPAQSLQMGFNLHSWRIHTEISPSYLLILRGDTVNGLSGSKGCDLICLHLHVWLSITMGSGSFPPGCNLALLLSPPWCAGALWWH